jgi:hypothetical protein
VFEIISVSNNYSKSISEQKVFLEKSSTRKTLERVGNDSASLVVHRDSTSSCSRWTNWSDNGSKVSKVFNFDAEVLLSKAYERARRASLKAAIRRKQADLKSEQNEEIKRKLRDDERRQRREIRLLLLGMSSRINLQKQ